MALIPCPNCSSAISEHARKCPKCGWIKAIEANPNESISKNVSTDADNHTVSPDFQGSNPKTIPEPTVASEKSTIEHDFETTKKPDKTVYLANTQTIGQPEERRTRTGIMLAIVAIALLCIAGGIGGFFYYRNIYLPEKIDREAPRSYPLVNLQLRSSKMAGGDFNKVTMVPYGGELITYDNDGEWAKVKYVMPSGEKSYEGFVASAYLVDKKDFYILNSLMGDNDVREVLATSKVRRALLQYFKQNGIIGKLSPEMQSEIGESIPVDNQWQIIFHRGQIKPNEVLFKRLVNPSSKFTDMAVLIENVKDHRRKALVFHFDDDETPNLIFEDSESIPQSGYIKDVVQSENGYRVIIDNTIP